MDIQISSNFERLLFELYDREGTAVVQLMDDLKGAGGFELSQGALERLKFGFSSARASEEQTLATIRATLEQTEEVVCPHTAVGIHGARVVERDPAVPMVVLATAHPAKFPDAVEQACGIRPELPRHMADLFDRPERITRVANDLEAIKAIVAGEAVA